LNRGSPAACAEDLGHHPDRLIHHPVTEVAVAQEEAGRAEDDYWRMKPEAAERW
jgi:hypothetical protein